MRRPLICALLITMLLTLTVFAGPQGAGNKHKSVAFLSGPGAMTGSVLYQSHNKKGKSHDRFRVMVKHAYPAHSYTVYVNGAAVGKLKTNPAGNGKFEMRSKHNMSKGCKKMPAGFPKLDTGDVVTLGADCCGIMWDCKDKNKQQYKSSGSVGDGYMCKEVCYKEVYKPEGPDKCFIVEVSGSDVYAGHTYDIHVNGIWYGSMTAGEDGYASWKMRTSKYIPPDDYSTQHMPHDFPMLKDGDVVQVGDKDVTLGNKTCGGNGNGDDNSSDDDSSSDDSSSGSSDDSSSGGSDDSSSGGSDDHSSNDSGSDDDSSSGGSGSGGGGYGY